MKKIGVTILFIILSACSKQKVDYAHAIKVYRNGLSSEEVRKVFGDPDAELGILNSEFQWDYFPDQGKNTEHPRDGFEISFKDNKTIKISPVIVSSR